MAMAARRERGLLDPEPPVGESLFDHDVFVIASDGDLEEGVSNEASSLAAHQQLGNLTLIYDDNKISIEDDTAIALSEDIAARYEAYGWHVQRIDWTNGGTGYEEDVQGLYDALLAARAETSRPSFIQLRTIIAWPARTSRTPARPTARPSVPRRSPPPSRCWASTRTRASTWPTR
jgi:transketolase